MNKKIKITLSIFVATALVGTGIFFGVRKMKMNEYKESGAILPKEFTITAHTGCMNTEENSIESMETGIENGAKIIEFDVNFLSDGTAILAHDEPTGNELKLESAFEFLANISRVCNADS